MHQHEAVGKPIARIFFVKLGARCARLESLVGYPKPVDLCVGRLKSPEREMEDRTVSDVQIVRMTCA